MDDATERARRRLRLLRLNAAACLMDFAGRSTMQALRDRDRFTPEQLDLLAAAVQAPTRAEQSARALAIINQVQWGQPKQPAVPRKRRGRPPR